MIQQPNYYKIGLFIITAVFLFIIAVIILGSDMLFREKIILETYVDESISGLSVGSPVQYRGVKVGSVTNIAFGADQSTDEITPQDRYIHIMCALDERYIGEAVIKKFETELPREIERGLRIRPTSQGVTGQLFLEIDYFDPKLNPPLPLRNEPEGLYVPAAPSTLGRIDSAVTTISKSLQTMGKTDLGGAVNTLIKIGEKLSVIMEEADVDEISHGILPSLNELQKLLARLNELFASPQMEAIIENTSGTLAGLNTIIRSSGKDIVQAAQNIRQSSAKVDMISSRFNQYLNSADGRADIEQVSSTLDNIVNTASKLNNATTQLADLLRRINGITAGQQTRIQSMIENTNAILGNLKELTEDLKTNPSVLLFSNPPERIEEKK